MRWFGISLGEGNMKVGEVLSFSLPSRLSCPGASRWCLEHCYARRLERIRPTCRRAYRDNLVEATDTDAFAEKLSAILPRILLQLRLHVSGDFFSVEYIEAWRRICQSLPETRFWAYTRSWNVPALQEALRALRDLDNVQLFASTDPTMPLPGKDWRRAFLASDPRARGLLCRAQTEDQTVCLDCGYCFRRSRGDVVFREH